MTKNWVLGLALLAVVAITISVNVGEARERDGAPSVQLAQEISDTLMQQKLKHAQDLLSSLSIGDFDRMITHARELQRISLEARWSQPHSPAYADYGEDFRSALERIAAAAEKQNIDGAALNYVQVVLTCVQCHKVVREGEAVAREADLGPYDLLKGLNLPATGD
jgi:ribosomal protein L22